MTGIFLSLVFAATRGLAVSKTVLLCFLFCLSLCANLVELANLNCVMHYTFHVFAVDLQKV